MKKKQTPKNLIDFYVTFIITTVAIAVLLTALYGCIPQKFESKFVKVDTKGTPIVDLILIGPGGDGISVRYEKIYDTGFLFMDPAFLTFLLGIGITILLVLLSDKKRKKD